MALIDTLHKLEELVDILRHREYDSIEEWAEADERLAGQMEHLLSLAYKQTS